MPTDDATDEAALLAAFRACAPDARRRLLEDAQVLAAGRPRRTLEDLLRAARARGLDVASVRVAILCAAGEPIARIRVRS